MSSQEYPIKKVIKRDGRVVEFDSNRIKNAIKKAMISVGKYDEKTLRKVTKYVLEVLKDKYGVEKTPHVEEIQDIVEFALVKYDLYEVAKAYILYRKEREKIRKEKMLLLNKDYLDEVDKRFSLNSIRLLASRYLLKDEKGKVIESPKQMFQRVAMLIVIPDILYDKRIFDKEGFQEIHKKDIFDPDEYDNRLGFTLPDGSRVTWNKYHLERMKCLYDELNEKGMMKKSWSEFLEMLKNGEFNDYSRLFLKYYNLMITKKFMPNSPTLFNAGTRLGQLSACFVLGIDDSIESIMDAAKDAALIFKSGGGIGINYSKLRPEGDIVFSTSGVACFHGDTRIFTDKGLIRVKDLVRNKHNTRVATHEGYKDIIERYDNGKMKLYHIVTEDGYDVYVSEEHKFLTIDKEGNMHLTPLKNLKTGDYLYILTPPKYDKDYEKLNTKIVHKGRANVNLPSKLDEDLAYIIGLLYADGHIRYRYYNDNIRSVQIDIYLDKNSEGEILKNITEKIKKVFGIKPRKYLNEKQNKVTVRISSIEIAEFLKLNKLSKEYSDTIRVPELIYRSKPSVIAAFLSGYLDGDGSIDRYYRITFKSNSKEFIKGLQLLLLSLGIVSRVKYTLNRKKEIGILRIQNKDMKIRAFKELKYSIKLSYLKKKALTYLSNRGRNRKYSFPFNAIYKIRDPHLRTKIQKDYKWLSYNSKVTHREFINKLLRNRNKVGLSSDEIKYFETLSKLYPNKIVKIEYYGIDNVYDLQIDGVHLLCGNGFYTSNSGPVSFMKIIDVVTDVIKQGGRRRGANMGILEIWHPDIEKFITAKATPGKLENFNISVMITRDFWDHYRDNIEYPLINPRNGEVWKRVNPRHIFHLISEMAWRTGDPGVLFLDNINKRNVLRRALGEIRSTNPCISGNTRVLTPKGWIKAEEIFKEATITSKTIKGVTVDDELLGEGGSKQAYRTKIITTIGKETVYKTSHNDRLEIYIPKAVDAWVWHIGKKRGLRIKTKEGFEITVTPEHKFLTPEGWKEANTLEEGDKIELSRLHPAYSDLLDIGEYDLDPDIAFALGCLVGDGSFNKHYVAWFFSGKDRAAEERVRRGIEQLGGNPLSHTYLVNKNEYKIQYNKGTIVYRRICEILGEYMERSRERRLPEIIWRLKIPALLSFLRGLFTSDGYIDGDKAVRLTSSSIKLLKEIQIILTAFGITSKIYNRPYKREFIYTDKDGNEKRYASTGYYELVISGYSKLIFKDLIGFEDINKLEKLSIKMLKRDTIWATVSSIEDAGIIDFYDLTVPIYHNYIGNGLINHNCGEEPLYPYESCNLGSMNLYAFIKYDEEGNPYFDWDEYHDTIRLALRFLDNVIDVNKFPIKKIEEATKRTRKVGLGLMGLADTLFALKIPYNSEEGFRLMKKFAEHLTYYAMDESIELARERGVFPIYYESEYPNGEMPIEGYYHREEWTLDWDKLRDKISKYGIRNAEVTTIAPTGSISMIADTSSGIEPQFALVYEKRVTVGTFFYVDPELEKQLRERGLYDESILKKISDNGGSIQDLEEIPGDMKKVFIVAYDIPWWDHIRAQAEISKWICAAVSKTINMPNWVTIEDVEKAYLFSYKLGVKGITIYRDGSKSVQVLITPSQRRGKYITTIENRTIEMMKELGIEPPKIGRPEKVLAKDTLTIVGEVKPTPEVTKQTVESKNIMRCPECGSERLLFIEDCIRCLDCGWSSCTV